VERRNEHFRPTALVTYNKIHNFYFAEMAEHTFRHKSLKGLSIMVTDCEQSQVSATTLQGRIGHNANAKEFF